jgi:hypothetical protein
MGSRGYRDEETKRRRDEETKWKDKKTREARKRERGGEEVATWRSGKVGRPAFWRNGGPECQLHTPPLALCSRVCLGI